MPKAELEIHIKRPVFSKNGKLLGILEIKIWRVRKDKCYPEGYKYSLVFAIYDGKTGKFDGSFLRYDNHRCEGHHKHIKGVRQTYKFLNIETLLEDFRNDLMTLLKEVENES